MDKSKDYEKQNVNATMTYSADLTYTVTANCFEITEK